MKKSLLLIPMLAISACATTTNDLTKSGFETPTNAGDIATSLTSSQRGSVINGTGDGYAYAVGIENGNKFAGYAGIVPTTSVSAPPAGGVAVWSGSYQLGQITDISLSGNTLVGNASNFSSALSLTANFNAGTLFGGDEFLTVIGAFTGSNLSGSVTYLGVPGPLTGLVGATGAVGAFQGNNATDLYAGGFMVGAP